jgi:hypothetical protein
MWWTGGQPHSRCAANGRYEHNYRSGTYNYQIYNGQGGSNQNNPQPNWRWCGRCSLLFWGGSSTGTQAGFCPGLYTNGLAGTGGPHLAGSDTDYCID